jgi:stage II sporulation protein D
LGRVVPLLLVGLLAGAPAAHAAAKSTLVMSGHGFGHGVGMSQWGAYGYAQHGATYDQILAHYYTGTALGKLPDNPEIRVLLRSGGSSAAFSGATHIGDRTLDPTTTYSVTRNLAGELILRSPAGRKLDAYESPLRVESDGAPMLLRGGALNGVVNGTYRGALEFRANTFKGIDIVDAVDLENYVRGVVPRESPASWPAAALQAQAVAARTYAVTTSGGAATRGFDQYPDQRSQVYGGVTAETPSTDSAVSSTTGQVVTYNGQPVVTYFFSTSGGRTENVENSFLGATPEPWLRSVDDPYDNASPKHVWGPFRLTGAQAASKLAGLVKGSFRGIKVVHRGASPRIVQAVILGSKGRTTVSGPTLRKRFGLADSWIYFHYISTSVKKAPPAPPVELAPATDPAAPSPTGGVAPIPPAPAKTATAAAVRGPILSGQVVPARVGAPIAIQVRHGNVWKTVVRATISGSGGRYRTMVPGPGVYRVVFAGIAGPAIGAR